MIKTFAHKGLERFFKDGSKRGIGASHAPRIRRILDRLDAVLVPEDMTSPGFGFHGLTGNRLLLPRLGNTRRHAFNPCLSIPAVFIIGKAWTSLTSFR